MPLGPQSSECEVCWEKPNIAALLRCSICKNRFYCGEKCQRQDWTKHKKNCSPLPDGELLPAKIETTGTLTSEFEKAIKLIQSIRESWKTINFDDHTIKTSEAYTARNNVPLVKDLKNFDLSPEYSYNTSLPLSPIVKVLYSIARLYLLYELSISTTEEAESFAKSVDSWSVPSDFPQLVGNKTISRPGELSPGEYSMLLQFLPVNLIAIGNGERAEKWFSLRVVWEGLGVGY